MQYLQLAGFFLRYLQQIIEKKYIICRFRLDLSAQMCYLCRVTTNKPGDKHPNKQQTKMATLTIDLRDAKRAQEIIRNENLPLPLSWLASDTYFCNRPDRDDMEDISEILHMHGIQHHWTAQDTPEPEPEPEPKTETRAVHSLAYHPTKIWDFICKMYGGDTLRHYITRHDYEGFADTISQEFHLNPEQWEAVLENFELITSTLMDI